MQYKTITLELLESFPDLASRLKRGGQFIAALEVCSTDFRTRHLTLTDFLRLSHQQGGPEELYRRAFEIALRELEARIRTAGRSEGLAHPDLLIEYLRRHTPPE